MHRSPRWKPLPRRVPSPPQDLSTEVETEVYFDDPFHLSNLHRSGVTTLLSSSMVVDTMPSSAVGSLGGRTEQPRNNRETNVIAGTQEGATSRNRPNVVDYRETTLSPPSAMHSPDNDRPAGEHRSGKPPTPHQQDTTIEVSPLPPPHTSGQKHHDDDDDAATTRSSDDIPTAASTSRYFKEDPPAAVEMVADQRERQSASTGSSPSTSNAVKTTAMDRQELLKREQETQDVLTRLACLISNVDEAKKNIKNTSDFRTPEVKERQRAALRESLLMSPQEEEDEEYYGHHNTGESRLSKSSEQRRGLQRSSSTGGTLNGTLERHSKLRQQHTMNTIEDDDLTKRRDDDPLEKLLLQQSKMLKPKVGDGSVNKATIPADHGERVKRLAAIVLDQQAIIERHEEKLRDYEVQNVLLAERVGTLEGELRNSKGHHLQDVVSKSISNSPQRRETLTPQRGSPLHDNASRPSTSPLRTYVSKKISPARTDDPPALVDELVASPTRGVLPGSTRGSPARTPNPTRVSVADQSSIANVRPYDEEVSVVLPTASSSRANSGDDDDRLHKGWKEEVRHEEVFGAEHQEKLAPVPGSTVGHGHTAAHHDYPPHWQQHEAAVSPQQQDGHPHGGLESHLAPLDSHSLFSKPDNRVKLLSRYATNALYGQR